MRPADPLDSRIISSVLLEPISKLNRHLFEEHMACRNMRISREIVTAAAGDFHVQGPYFDFEIGSIKILLKSTQALGCSREGKEAQQAKPFTQYQMNLA